MSDLIYVGVTLIGSALSLFLNLIANKKLLIDTDNKRNYLLAWALSGTVLMIIAITPERAEELTVLFYGIVGVSLPQLALYQMTINDLNKSNEDLKKALEISKNVIHRHEILYEKIKGKLKE